MSLSGWTDVMFLDSTNDGKSSHIFFPNQCYFCFRWVNSSLFSGTRQIPLTHAVVDFPKQISKSFSLFLCIAVNGIHSSSSLDSAVERRNGFRNSSGLIPKWKSGRRRMRSDTLARDSRRVEENVTWDSWCDRQSHFLGRPFRVEHPQLDWSSSQMFHCHWFSIFVTKNMGLVS